MDVVALGELLIDFTENGQSGQNNLLFEANPGGAPCNVLAMLKKLGRETAFIGKVGNDNFGRLLERTIVEQGICAEGLVYDASVPTTLAFVHTKADGDRDFSFYRNPGADMMLEASEINTKLIDQTKVFHFGSLSMTAPQVEEATIFAIKRAKEAKAIISFDPNLRPPLWRNLNDAKEKIGYGLSQCDVLKISDNEIAFMTDETDIDRGVQRLIEKYEIPFICATMGKHGSRAFFDGKRVDGRPFIRKDTIETTGAGDTFCACMLDFILQYGIDDLQETHVKNMLEFANAAAAIITTRKGALRVMPEKIEIMEFMKGESVL